MPKSAKIITCLDFGLNCVTDYPSTFFCAQCKNWEDLGFAKGRCKRDSRRFTCAANHTSLTVSAQNKKQWRRMATNKIHKLSNDLVPKCDDNKKMKKSPWCEDKK